jgi:hypothetical protein
VTLGEIEQRKLTASYLNTIAAAFMITGVVAPIVAIAYGLPGPQPGWQAILVSFAWLTASACVHWLARRLLRNLSA